MPLQLVERLVERVHVGHVAIDQQFGSKLLRERPDALLQRLALVRKSQLGALVAQRARNAPGQRTVVRQPHDQALLALH